jgi:eukaryotic-like serine/threonine-protein kinase
VMLAIAACDKEVVPTTTTPTNTTPGTTTPTATKSTAKDITKFSFAAFSPAVDAVIDGTGKTISGTLAASADLSKLVPTIAISDKASVSPASGVAQDFSKEVSYTVTAEDGTLQAYKVNLKKEVVANSNPSNEMVFLGGGENNKFYAFDAETGVKKWEVNTTGSVLNSPGYSKGLIYFGTKEVNARLYALDATSGNKRWEFTTNNNGSLSAPNIIDGVVYFAGRFASNDVFYAVDATTGKEIWKVNLLKTSGQDGFFPSVSEGIVYISSRPYLFALDIKTGKEIWKFKIDIEKYPFELAPSSPKVANGIVYVGGNRFYALEAKTGVLIWQKNGASGANDSYGYGLCFTNEIVFTSNITPTDTPYNIFYALEAATGKEIWKNNNGRVVGAATFQDNVFLNFYSGGSKLGSYIAKSGQKNWESTFQVFGPPTPANNTLYFSSYDNKLQAVNIDKGNLKWEISLGKLCSHPIVIDKTGKVFYSSNSGMVQ